jgi:hypothetical protein
MFEEGKAMEEDSRLTGLGEEICVGVACCEEGARGSSWCGFAFSDLTFLAITSFLSASVTYSGKPREAACHTPQQSSIHDRVARLRLPRTACCER